MLSQRELTKHRERSYARAKLRTPENGLDFQTVNHATTAGVLAVLELAGQQLADSAGSAVALIDNRDLFTGDYWSDVEGFHARLEPFLIDAERVVFATPVIIRHDDESSYRAPDGVLFDHESEWLFVLTADLSNGLDVLRAEIDRTTAPRLGDAELYTGQLRLDANTPGFHLVQTLLPNGEVDE